MLDSYYLVKLAHILLFVYWLGGDIGVFHSAGYVRDAALSRDARATALKILAWIDMIPRYCLVLTLPVGYTLATKLGVVSVASGMVIGVWLMAFVWLALVYAVHHYQGRPFGQSLRSIDLLWRIGLVLWLIWVGSQGLRGAGHIGAPWLAAKLLVFAFLIFCGIMIRVRGAPLAQALRELLTSGSTPQHESTIKRNFGRTRPFVLLIWAGLVLAAYFGIAKPQFGDSSLMVDSPVVENSVVENPVFTLVKFPSGAPLPPAALAELLRKTSPRYQTVPGLRRKLFLSGPGVGGGWYEWDSRAHAEAFYDDAWRRGMQANYGLVPTIEYFDAPCIVDNDRGVIDYYLQDAGR